MNALGWSVTILLLVVLGLWYFTRRMASLVEARIPPLGRFVDVVGARLHYVDRGETKDQLSIVMLHGLGGQLHHFNFGLVEALSCDTRVIAIDRPGSGYSERIADQATTHSSSKRQRSTLCSSGSASNGRCSSVILWAARFR